MFIITPLLSLFFDDDDDDVDDDDDDDDDSMMKSFEPGTVSTSEIELLTQWISVPSRSEGDQRGRRPAMLHAAQQQPGFGHRLVTCWFPLGS